LPALFAMFVNQLLDNSLNKNVTSATPVNINKIKAIIRKIKPIKRVT
jgi:hypothetical protein